MQHGFIRRCGSETSIGTWAADERAIRVETADLDLRAAAESVLNTPQTVPTHAAERFEFAGPAVPVVRTPSTVQFLALFALEMEARGFEVVPDED